MKRLKELKGYFLLLGISVIVALIFINANKEIGEARQNIILNNLTIVDSEKLSVLNNEYKVTLSNGAHYIVLRKGRKSQRFYSGKDAILTSKGIIVKNWFGAESLAKFSKNINYKG